MSPAKFSEPFNVPVRVSGSNVPVRVNVIAEIGNTRVIANIVLVIEGTDGEVFDELWNAVQRILGPVVTNVRKAP